MADAHAKHHDYHLVNPSPWPLTGAIGAFILAVGAVHYFHGAPLWYVAPGFALVLYTMFGWWRDVIREANGGDHTPVVQLHLRYGMILFIASEVMFFVAWFWAFFDASLFPGEAIQHARSVFTGGHWPPQGIEVFDPWHIPLLNTLVLLASGTTVTWAHHSLQHDDRKGLIQGLIFTVVLDLLHGDRLPWFPRYRRHHLPRHLPDPRHPWRFHRQAALRLRSRRLVLALR